MTFRASAGLYSLDRTTVLSWLITLLTRYCGVGGPKMDQNKMDRSGSSLVQSRPLRVAKVGQMSASPVTVALHIYTTSVYLVTGD